MYSLYRAWLLRESSPPDVIVCVGSGSHQFSGHRNVLSAQSGYLKSLLSEPQPPESLSSHTQILVPNVSPEVFAPLLTFMYTGYLDLTPDNIYGVLLATHLLHMPRALDLCRSYLLHQQQAAAAAAVAAQLPPPLVKPIPSRKMLPLLLPPPHPPPAAPPPPPTSVYWPSIPPLPPLPEQDTAHYRSVFPLALSKPETETEATEDSKAMSQNLPAVPSTSASTSNGLAESSSSPRRRSGSSVSPCLSQASDSSDQVTVTVTHRPKRQGQLSDGNGKKVVVDVACCDGPVRFHRVLNRNYGVDLHLQETSSESAENNSASSSSTSRPPNKPEESSTEGPPVASASAAGHHTVDTGPVFTCHYCNHTFKSHYCYQKHARRHINPVNLEIRTPQPQISPTEKQPTTVNLTPPIQPQPQPQPQPQTPQQPQQQSHNNRRQVRLLDMNVQYYPCKTCGSKFPSYYFVHKHRKICHPGEDNAPPPQENESQNND